MDCECREGFTCNACWIEQEKNYDEYMDMDNVDLTLIERNVMEGR